MTMRRDKTDIAFGYDTATPGAVAQLVEAPVSKTGGPRFESWLPRLKRLRPKANVCLCYATNAFAC